MVNMVKKMSDQQNIVFVGVDEIVLYPGHLFALSKLGMTECLFCLIDYIYTEMHF